MDALRSTRTSCRLELDRTEVSSSSSRVGLNGDCWLTPSVCFPSSLPGPPRLQVGAVNRAAWITAWGLHCAGLGMDDAWIESQREKDEIALPEVDVGLFVRYNVVYAVKA